VLGAGTGGMPAGYETKERIGVKDSLKYVMVNERPANLGFCTFLIPMGTLSVGERTRSQIYLSQI